jgi:hypothetical protein
VPEATWLLLVHHLPSRPTRLRVRVWRQLQRLGAVAVKNSVYVLPCTDKTREDFTWLQQEIEAGGGEAIVFQSGAVAGTTDREIIAAFHRERDAAYARLANGLAGLARRMARRRRGQPSSREREDFEREVGRMQTEFNVIEETDYFKAPRRAEAVAALGRCRGLLRAAPGRRDSSAPRAGGEKGAKEAAKYQGRLWVTRPRPHIDRCASAWLIQRFIDRRPRFAFAAEGIAPRGGIPYDTSGAEFSHRGEDCTYETLMKQFCLDRDGALRAIGEIVHDVDLKDGKFGRPEAAGVNAVIRGLAERIRNDRELLRAAMAVFDGLHATLAAKPAGRRKDAPRRRK